MSESVYKKVKKANASKTEDKENEAVEAVKETKEEESREATDLYYDKASKKFIRVTVKYTESGRAVVSKETMTGNMAVELSKINNLFALKLMKDRRGK